MPYNTRRKSLSLPSLGIHVPMSNAARAAAAAIANRHSPSASSATSASQSTVSTTSSAASPSPSSSSSSSPSPIFSPRSPADSMTRKVSDSHAHAQASARKIKRSHAQATADGDHSAPAPKRRQTDANTPPPSPRHRSRGPMLVDDADDAACEAGIDLASIDDEIVRAVIVQLQATRNRPHIVRDLAAVLMKQLKIVQQSANPCAIISSRLSGYLKRSGWSAKNPCPLAKELETVHPRRTYFFLTTVPHQPLPDPMLSATKPRELPTPSATSGSEAEEDERRRELSPSPEVDLSAPEFDDVDDDIPMPGTPIGSFPGRHNSVLALAVQSHRGASPPLEKDEKEFTQTADGLQRRKLSGELLNMRVEPAAAPTMDAADEHAKYESLFGERAAAAAAAATVPHAPATAALGGLLASPAIRPFYSVDIKKEKESEATWPSLDSHLDIRNPETVSLAELNEMLGDY